VFGNKKLGRVGDLLLVVLKIYVNTKKVKKGTKYLGLLINVCTWQTRLNGVYFKMFDNRVILFNKEFKQLSSRVYGVCSKDIYSNLSGSHRTIKLFLKAISFFSLLV